MEATLTGSRHWIPELLDTTTAPHSYDHKALKVSRTGLVVPGKASVGDDARERALVHLRLRLNLEAALIRVFADDPQLAVSGPKTRACPRSRPTALLPAKQCRAFVGIRSRWARPGRKRRSYRRSRREIV